MMIESAVGDTKQFEYTPFVPTGEGVDDWSGKVSGWLALELTLLHTVVVNGGGFC